MITVTNYLAQYHSHINPATLTDGQRAMWTQLDDPDLAELLMDDPDTREAIDLYLSALNRSKAATTPAAAPKAAKARKLKATRKGARAVRPKSTKVVTRQEEDDEDLPRYKRGSRVRHVETKKAGTVQKVSMDGNGNFVAVVKFDHMTGESIHVFEDMLVDGPDKTEKPAKARKAKKPAKEKTVKPVRPEPRRVRFDSPAVQVVRSYVALHGKEVPVKRAVNQLKKLQKLVLEQRIRKADPLAKEVVGIQTDLLRLCNQYAETEMVTVEIGPADDLARLLAAAGGEAVYQSVKALKSFVNAQGGINTVGRPITLANLQLLRNKLASKAIKADDPLRVEVDNALNDVQDAIDSGDTRLAAKPTGLSGVGHSRDLAGLLGAIDRHSMRLTGRGKSNRTPKAPCKCHG